VASANKRTSIPNCLIFAAATDTFPSNATGMVPHVSTTRPGGHHEACSSHSEWSIANLGPTVSKRSPWLRYEWAKQNKAQEGNAQQHAQQHTLCIWTRSSDCTAFGQRKLHITISVMKGQLGHTETVRRGRPGVPLCWTTVEGPRPETETVGLSAAHEPGVSRDYCFDFYSSLLAQRKLVPTTCQISHTYLLG